MELLSVVAIILSFIALKRASDVSERLDGVEKRNKEFSKSHGQVAHVNNQPSTVTTQHTEVMHPQGNAHVTANTQGSSLEASAQPLRAHVSTQQVYKEPAFIVWLKEDWLLKLGGVLVIMGVLFFLSLAFEVIGNAGKIAIGYLFGVSFMIFGFRYAGKQIIAGSSIHLVGAIIIIISSYVAHQPSFDVFNSYFAMLMMFLTTVIIALTSFMYKRAPLAHVGLAIAGFVPVLTQVQGTTFFEILVYLAVVVAGVVWLAFVTRWRSLILMSLGIVLLYSLSYISGGMGDTPLLGKETIMITAFGALFYITSLFSILRTAGNALKEDVVVALLNAGFAILWITSQAQPELAPILIATVGLIYAVGFFFVYKVTNVYTSFLVYGGVALGMLTTAIMLEFSGRGLVVTLLLMGAGVSVLTYQLSKDEEITKILSFFNLLPLFYVLGSIGNISGYHYPSAQVADVWKDFLIIGLAIVVYYTLYRFFVSSIKNLSYISLSVVVVLLITVVWQVLHLITTAPFATELSLLIIGLGLTMFIHNLLGDDTLTEKVAFVNLLAFVGIITSIDRIGRFNNSSYSNPDIEIWKDWFLVALVMGGALFLYYFFKGRIQNVAYTGFAAGLFLIATSIWQLSHLLMEAGIATFVSLLTYVVIGLYNLWKGSLDHNDIKIKISRGWLGFVALRVIFIDAWQADDVAVGVLICIVTGVLLISSVLIIKKSTVTTV